MNRLIVVALVGGLAVGAWVNGSRWESKYQQLELTHASAENDKHQRNMDSIMEATQAWSAATKNNEASYENLQRSLAAMRSTIGGLRNDFAGLPGFVRDASRENLQQYSTACTAIFERMAAAGGEMAESGAGIARKADQHAADSLK